MKRLITVTVLAALLALFPFVLNGKGPGKVRARVGTYNLRMSPLDKGEDAWELRRPRLSRSILKSGFDILGLQECDKRMQACLLEDIGDRYSFKFFSPYSQDGEGSRAQGIAWRSDRYELSAYHFFWTSDPPELMADNDPRRSGGFHRRGGCCGIITHRKSGVRFFFMVTHAPLNRAANAASAKIFIEMEKKYNPDGLPSIFVGDMNTRPNTPCSEELRTWWTDSFSAAPSRKGPEGTFCSLDPSKEIDPERRIDYIYVRGKIRLRRYVCERRLYDGRYASDHLPVWADMEILQ